METDELNRRFGRDGLRFDNGAGGLIRATLSSRDAEVEIYLYGAHVSRYQRHGEPPLLFMSEKSLFTPGKAIRGGIPVIFPWFGANADDPKKPAHGFARTAHWNVASADDTRIALRLSSDDNTRALWPHDFVATLTVVLGDHLSVSLDVANTSSDEFVFEEALHTYLTVGDVREVSLRGLEETTYIDKTDSMKRKRTAVSPLRIEKETDSVFLNTMSTCILEDPKLGRTITVEKSGSRSTVIWNPWIEKAKAMSDFGDDEWQRMLCIETCNVANNSIQLEPGGRSVMTTRIGAGSAP